MSDQDVSSAQDALRAVVRLMNLHPPLLDEFIQDPGAVEPQDRMHALRASPPLQSSSLSQWRHLHLLFKCGPCVGAMGGYQPEFMPTP